MNCKFYTKFNFIEVDFFTDSYPHFPIVSKVYKIFQCSTEYEKNKFESVLNKMEEISHDIKLAVLNLSEEEPVSSFCKDLIKLMKNKV